MIDYLLEFLELSLGIDWDFIGFPQNSNLHWNYRLLQNPNINPNINWNIIPSSSDRLECSPNCRRCKFLINQKILNKLLTRNLSMRKKNIKNCDLLEDELIDDLIDIIKSHM